MRMSCENAAPRTLVCLPLGPSDVLRMVAKDLAAWMWDCGDFKGGQCLVIS